MPKVKAPRSAVERPGDIVRLNYESPEMKCRADGCAAVCRANSFFCSRCWSLLTEERRASIELAYERWKARPAARSFGLRCSVEAARRELAELPRVDVQAVERRPRRVSLVLAWYDLWVGVYWDRKARALYVLPIPMLGIVIRFGRGT